MPRHVLNGSRVLKCTVTAMPVWMASSRVRTNGSLQWTYGGKPLYLYSGDMTGDGFGGVWHVVSQ